MSTEEKRIKLVLNSKWEWGSYGLKRRKLVLNSKWGWGSYGLKRIKLVLNSKWGWGSYGLKRIKLVLNSKWEWGRHVEKYPLIRQLPVILCYKYKIHRFIWVFELFFFFFVRENIAQQGPILAYPMRQKHRKNRKMRWEHLIHTA